MTFEQADQAAEPRIGVAPLVDIVFLLICFYLFVMQSIQNQEDPTVRLPTISAAIAAEEQPAELVINLKPDGTVSVNQHPLEIDQLGAHLARIKRDAVARDAALIVVVRADRQQSFDRLDRVLEACREAGLEHVMFRALETSTP